MPGLIREGVADSSAGVGQKLRALFRDPVRFGIFFELIFVNVVVTVPGVYVAFNLDTYRSPAYLAVERTILVGHWHVLATLSAVIALFLIADRLGTKGWVRQVVGWGLLAGSTLSFIFVNAYMFRQPGQEKAWTMPLFEAGIALSLLALALFCAVHLVGSLPPVIETGSFPKTRFLISGLPPLHGLRRSRSVVEWPIQTGTRE